MAKLFLVTVHTTVVRECYRGFSVNSSASKLLGPRHGKDPALEGTAVLELGLRLVKECEEGDLESADLVWAPRIPRRCRVCHGDRELHAVDVVE